VAEGQEKNWGTPQGILEEVTGSEKISQSLNSVIAADVIRSSPSSLRYENQVEVHLPLATLWVVLRNQLLKAGRPHPNVGMGWLAAVGDGHVALGAIPSSLAGKHRCPVRIVILSPRVGQPYLSTAA
jgi:hypothetical protein